MHYHTEIIIPPTEDVAAAIASVMKPFDENSEDNEGHPFWDFYVIGGRWAGTKQMAKYDPKLVEEFERWSEEQKLTVSGLQAGKQSLSPADQIPKVDAKWRELFPYHVGACPLFAHSNDQYGRRGPLSGTIEGDVMKLVDVPTPMTCSRVIFAGHDVRGERIEPTFMLVDKEWNGVNHMPVKWDGTISDALRQFREKTSHYRAEYFATIDPKDDWLVVTVDYHS